LFPGLHCKGIDKQERRMKIHVADRAGHKKILREIDTFRRRTSGVVIQAIRSAREPRIAALVFEAAFVVP
jgi:hypothetical protein